MATKTITIMDDAYRILKDHKRSSESFSDVIRRIGKNDLSRFAGRLSHIDAEEMKKSIKELRKSAKMRKVNV